MVDLTILQPISWVAAAFGVCLAALYYALNLRETTRNRRAILTNSMMQPFASPEAMQNWFDVMNLQWKNFDDFVEKYDSQVNPQGAAKRLSLWTSLDILGYQFKSGLIDNETVYSTMRGVVVNSWLKFGPIIKEYKERSEFPSDAFGNFEYMANELSRMYRVRDPSYKGAASYFKPEEYDEVFKSDKQTP